MARVMFFDIKNYRINFKINGIVEYIRFQLQNSHFKSKNFSYGFAFSDFWNIIILLYVQKKCTERSYITLV